MARDVALLVPALRFQIVQVDSVGLGRRHRRAECCRITKLGLQHGDSAQVGLQLHQQLIVGHDAVRVQFVKIDAAVLLHSLNYVTGLETNGFEGGPNDVVLGGETRQAADDGIY